MDINAEKNNYYADSNCFKITEIGLGIQFTKTTIFL
jgi:hypothetical protein